MFKAATEHIVSTNHLGDELSYDSMFVRGWSVSVESATTIRKRLVSGKLKDLINYRSNRLCHPYSVSLHRGKCECNLDSRPYLEHLMESCELACLWRSQCRSLFVCTNAEVKEKLTMNPDGSKALVKAVLDVLNGVCTPL